MRIRIIFMWTGGLAFGLVAPHIDAEDAPNVNWIVVAYLGLVKVNICSLAE